MERQSVAEAYVVQQVKEAFQGTRYQPDVPTMLMAAAIGRAVGNLIETALKSVEGSAQQKQNEDDRITNLARAIGSIGEDVSFVKDELKRLVQLMGADDEDK